MESRARVLVVDDEESLRSSLTKILEHYGFCVSVAANATEAIEKIGRLPFDLLLTDLRMPPPGDGFSVIEAMQQARPACVNLLMSANLEAAAVPSVSLKADQIVHKPFSVPSLVKLIQDKLGCREAGLRAGSELGVVGQISKR
jgi:DNA-binding NtrC family response regulator